MYKVDLYIENTRLDLFEKESVEISLSIQNVKDISKVFGDVSKTFSVPASPTNNGVFKHYYNVDISGGFNANTRKDAWIEVNNNVFRVGKVELESVTIKNGEPSSYNVVFFSALTALKDLFGEDELTDLDLSAYNHTYNDTNIKAGINGYVSGTSNNVTYPLISPVRNWYYDSNAATTDIDNIANNGGSANGVYWYDLKPAIRLSAIVDAIEAKYGIEFQSTFFSDAKFTNLFIWGHRRVGYMFKDQPNGFTPQVINFTAASNPDFDIATDEYIIDAANITTADVQITTTSTDSYKLYIYVNDVLHTWRGVTGGVTALTLALPPFSIGDRVQIRFSPQDDWDGSTVTISTISAYFRITPTTGVTATRTTSQSITSTVVMADQMPEQKVSDFIGGLVRAFNLVVQPTTKNKYRVEPLEDWYALGSTIDITDKVDTSEITARKIDLYKRIEFMYSETEAVLGNQYLLQNGIGYGDLKADFTFDGEEFSVELPFDNMLFERPTDQDTGLLTELNIGKSITRELESYIGQPFIFYMPDTITSSDAITYIDMAGGRTSYTTIWLCSNTNAAVAGDVTATINFGTEVDPYHLQGYASGLYSTYWSTYISNLYNANRRLWKYSAVLDLGTIITIKPNDTIVIMGRTYRVNQVAINVTTGEAELELINDV